MAYQSQPVEINTFNAGLITDASPLTSPENSSLEEENFVLNLDGSRQRRLGIDFEEDWELVQDNQFQTPDQLSTYLWRNAGGTGENFIVVSTGNFLRIFHTESRPYSSNLVYTINLYPGSTPVNVFIDMTTINDMLVFPMDSGATYVEYDGSGFSHRFDNIKVRDLFGIDDVIGSIDFYDSNNISSRPDTLTQAHRYNLRNQGWGIPRPHYIPTWSGGQNTEVGDPIEVFYDSEEQEATRFYPSNADAVSQSLIADPTDEDNPTLRRFSPEDLFKNPIGSTPAARGYFIISPFSRSIDRSNAYSENQTRYPDLIYPLGTIPNDFSNVFGNSLTIERFAGRVWYAGYSSNTVESIDTSPTVNSYVFFSQLVETPKDIYRCHQENDPTSPDMPDILETDGGFVNITGAENIVRLKEIFEGLLVFAENGVWRISGTSNNGFTATSYMVDKVTDRGCYGRDSIVVVGNSVFYWGKDGIYVISPNQYGELESQRVTEGRIQNLFFSISDSSKRSSKGIYDSQERKVKWIYNNSTDFTNPQVVELVLDMQLQAFYLNRVRGVETARCKTVGYLEIPDEHRSINYLIFHSSQQDDRFFSFGDYTNENFIDWESIDGVGVDADAFLVTSYFSGGDFQRRKGVPYLTTHLRRTETGIDQQGDYLNSSSCIVQAQWDWSNSSVSNKWGRPFQAYRYKKDFIPQTLPSSFNTGFSTIVTKHKLRGSGKVISLRFSTEPGKDLHLYGWSMVFAISGIV